MIIRALLILALPLILFRSVPLRAEDLGEFKDAAQLLAEIDSIPLRIQEEIDLFLERAVAGEEADGWTKERKTAAMKRIEDIVTPPPNARPGMTLIERIMTSSQRGLLFFPGPPNQGAGAIKPPKTPDELNQWFAGRIAALMRFRSSLIYRYGDGLIDYAETEWLRAKTPDDLKPVAAAFSALKEREPRFLSSSDFARPMKREPAPPYNPAIPFLARMAEFSRVRNETFEACILTGSGKPFVLPDPEINPEGFWKARKALFWLRKIEFTFLKKPRIEAHLGALDLRFRKASITARELAGRLILQDAPLDQVAPAIERLHFFEEKPMNIIADPPRTPEADPLLPGYQEVIARNTGGFTSMRDVHFQNEDEKHEAEELSSTLKLGDLWVEFLRAQKTGESQKTTSELRAQLLQISAQLSEAMKLHLTQSSLPAPAQVTRPAAPEVAHIESADPVEALISELEKTPSAKPPSIGNDNPDAADIYAAQASEAAKSQINAWRTLSMIPPGRIEADHGLDWQSLLGQPGSLKLLKLRDRAARKLLAQIEGRNSAGDEGMDHLPEAVQAALDQSVSSDALKTAFGILALDFTASLLPALERGRWTQILREFNTAAACSEQSPKQARGIYIHILESTAETACARLADKRLRELSAREAALPTP